MAKSAQQKNGAAASEDKEDSPCSAHRKQMQLRFFDGWPPIDYILGMTPIELKYIFFSARSELCKYTLLVNYSTKTAAVKATPFYNIVSIISENQALKAACRLTLPKQQELWKYALTDSNESFQKLLYSNKINRRYFSIPQCEMCTPASL